MGYIWGFAAGENLPPDVYKWRDLMIKPDKLNKGDTIAAVSPSWGCAGAPRVLWKYRSGCERLKELGLNVVAAPNSLRGTSYLKDNPQARAEDIMWAFENKNVKGIIANIGGNDSAKLLPYLSDKILVENPKILCGYSDVMALHLYCYRAGLMTYYGDNLLTSVAEAGGWHPYSRYWFEKMFFDDSVIGTIQPSREWSYDKESHTDKKYRKKYIPNPGYYYVQGKGTVKGKLFGGHGDLCTLLMPDGNAAVRKEDFENSILFFEDIPDFCDEKYMADFFDWLGKNGYLQILSGVIIGKMKRPANFDSYAERIRLLVSDKYGCPDLPIMSDLNFGHTSPICILPYGAEAELNIDKLTFSILESAVKRCS